MIKIMLFFGDKIVISHFMEKLVIYTGQPLPFGTSRLTKNILNFSLFSQSASRVTLVIQSKENFFSEIELDPAVNKTGFVWHVAIENLPRDLCYGFRLDGPPHIGYVFDYNKIVCDPYAKQICSSNDWGNGTKCLYPIASYPSACMGYILNDDFSFNWENDKRPNIPIQDLIIYELHVRSFTKDPSSKTKYPGTFLGIIEKIDYLKSLGINAIELLPIFEFDENKNPFKSEKFPHLCNYWGYSPINFFSPMNRYASNSKPGTVISEFKTMVKELHKNNIEIILDVVFNHTQDDQKNYYSLRGIDHESYYILDPSGNPTNYSGCGNSLNANYQPVTELLKDSLRYWVTEMHVDGFRFDLASIMTRGSDGNPQPNPSFFETISFDPILANSKMIAEPWDVTGLYQLGYFSQISSKWLEWNDVYRDTVRRFINGDDNLVNNFSTRIKGSPDIYSQNGSPKNSINFITAHDGFTLRDLVSYQNKHNENNGECNKDGTNANYSRNFGKEGSADNQDIETTRVRQIKNFQLALMISRGIPMIASGDEYGHTGEGNNNRWCHDSRLNYFLWDQLTENNQLLKFYQNTIRIRKEHKILSLAYFPENQEFTRYLENGMKIESDSNSSPFVAFLIKDDKYLLYAAFNTSENMIRVSLPKIEKYDGFFEIMNSGNSINSGIVENLSMDPHSSILLKNVPTSIKNHPTAL